ncbi:hypothetical protein BIV57_05290 [Mangrovactinospora gilvigrisea]|uniref:Uncharacterized protein n=1 Tax=Mangrovactinospora gilvigrisea TaxID=1428644 RepID=A0A1J7BIM8_9ACTN|nr:hypothetical protein [Mangrovactinospora gilvigrisea]OIV38523.1 hypothetical protein BIV57_05290 [Mangrovactinospora gilvigrisea]
MASSRNAGPAAAVARAAAAQAVLLPFLLLAAAPMAFAGGGTRSWRRRNEAARADAQSAKDAAAQAFYELDTAQRDLRISIETIGAVDDSPGARRALGDFETLGARINEVSTAYIDTLDRHDLDAAELETSAAQDAQRELSRAKEDLVRARRDLESFSAALEPLLERAAGQLAQVAPAVERAKQSWLTATASVEEVKKANLKADDLMARLVALNADLTKLNEGAGVHGVRPTLERATAVQRAAEIIRTEADRLPERAREIDRRVRSLRTRLDAARTRLEQVQPTLSELRRRFSVACWEDLQQVDRQAEQALRTAEQRLADAARARDEQRWPDATGALGTVRSLLNDADGAVAAPGDRLRRLNEVERNPRQEIDQARFAVRDAQRLAMSMPGAGPVVDPRWARPLDEAVERLERVERGLEAEHRKHPDYWAFLQETEGIKETAAEVVRGIREAMAQRR